MARSTKITVNDAEIALRAYRIWEAEGRPGDKDFDHWLRAKAEIEAEVSTKRPTAKRGSRKAAAKP